MPDDLVVPVWPSDMAVESDCDWGMCGNYVPHTLALLWVPFAAVC